MNSFDSSPLVYLRTVYDNRYEPEFARVFADLYWRTLLLLACIIVIGASLFGATTFFSAISDLGSNLSATAPSVIPARANLDRKRLDATIQSFSDRQAGFQRLQSQAVPPLADPSQ